MSKTQRILSEFHLNLDCFHMCVLPAIHLHRVCFAIFTTAFIQTHIANVATHHMIANSSCFHSNLIHKFTNYTFTTYHNKNDSGDNIRLLAELLHVIFIFGLDCEPSNHFCTVNILSTKRFVKFKYEFLTLFQRNFHVQVV